jgi:putative transposase
MDETVIKVGSEYIRIWIAIVEQKVKEIFGINISKQRNMFVAGRFISEVVDKYELHPVSTDGGNWYPQACKFLKIEHYIHSSSEKSIIERTMQYIKDSAKRFDDYFPCRKKKCKLKHVINWLDLFVDCHNRELCLK